MENKILLKHGVLTRGKGETRVVLCYESGLVYQYSQPENILAVFAKGGWVLRKRPSYHRGGWGNGSTGDYTGNTLMENTKYIIQAIGGKVFHLNTYEFLTPKEISTLNREIAKNNRLIQRQNEIAKKLNRSENEYELRPLETLKIEADYHNENRSKSPKGKDVLKTARLYENAVSVFVEGKGKGVCVDSYTITAKRVSQGDTVVAFRDSENRVFMNSQMLRLSDFERNFMGGQSLIQKSIREIATFSIPFNVLASANLKLDETRVLEQGPESTHTLRNGEERHFTGALLLENAGRKFLMDIDRIEIEHSLFNAFFVEVNSGVKSIAEAYESMKPDSVRDAEKNGVEVKRQGEWFFVATDETVKVNKNRVFRYSWSDDEDDTQPRVIARAVSHGKGRPNNLFKPQGFGGLDEFVCGVVSHQGREHKDLDLGSHTEGKDGETVVFKLWKLVPNTTVSNFTINGDID